MSRWRSAICCGSRGYCRVIWVSRSRIKRPVRDLVLEKLPVTAELAALAIVIALSIGLPMADARGPWKRSRLFDYVATMTALWGRRSAEFLARDLLILLFSVEWGLLPASGLVAPPRVCRATSRPSSCQPLCLAIPSLP